MPSVVNVSQSFYLLNVHAGLLVQFSLLGATDQYSTTLEALVQDGTYPNSQVGSTQSLPIRHHRRAGLKG